MRCKVNYTGKWIQHSLHVTRRQSTNFYRHRPAIWRPSTSLSRCVCVCGRVYALTSLPQHNTAEQSRAEPDPFSLSHKILCEARQGESRRGGCVCFLAWKICTSYALSFYEHYANSDIPGNPFLDPTAGEGHLHAVCVCVSYFMRLFSESTFTMCFQQLLRDFSLSAALATCHLPRMLPLIFGGGRGICRGAGLAVDRGRGAEVYRLPSAGGTLIAPVNSWPHAHPHTHAGTHTLHTHTSPTHSHTPSLLIITCVPWREHFDMNTNCCASLHCGRCRGESVGERVGECRGASFKLRAIGLLSLTDWWIAFLIASA